LRLLQMLTPFLVFLDLGIRDQTLYILIIISSTKNRWNEALFNVRINLIIDPEIKAQVSESLRAPHCCLRYQGDLD
jgi:hypothetical protein